MRRFPLAFVTVGVMSLLAAGGAVLGAFQAPTGVGLAVHNGAGETLLASRVVGSFTSSQLAGTVISFDFRAPDHVTEEAIGLSGKVEERQKVSGSKALEVLAPVRALLSLESFSTRGSYYENTRLVRDLVAPSERDSVSGTFRTRVQLESGYVVAILERIDAKEGSQHITETADYHLTRIDGWASTR